MISLIVEQEASFMAQASSRDPAAEVYDDSVGYSATIQLNYSHYSSLFNSYLYNLTNSSYKSFKRRNM